MSTTLIVLSIPSHGSVMTVGRGTTAALPSITADLDDEDESPIARVREFARDQLGLDSIVLELHVPPRSGEGEPSVALLVLEPPPPDWSPAPGCAWRPAADIDRLAVPESVRARASQWLDEATGSAAVPVLRAAWSRPGWHARATEWIDESLAAAGRSRTGQVEQIRLWGISTLLRAPTTEGTVWLKAAYPPFAAEPRTIRVIAKRFPDRVPGLVATNDEQGWTLLDDFGASLVGDNRHGAVGVAAIRSLIAMQQAFTPHVSALLDAGAVDRPLHHLPDQLAAAFDYPIGPEPWRQDRDRRQDLVDQLRRAVDRVEGLGLPDSLVHGDFHSWNVADVAGKPVIFDWTDTAVGNPIVDFATWVGRAKDREERMALFEPWVAAWSPFIPEAALRARHDDVLAVGAAYQVVSYVEIVRTLEPELASQISGGAVSFANRLEEALSFGR